MRTRGFNLNENAVGSEQRIQFIGRSSIDPDRELTVKYPDSFPSKAPRVFTSAPVLLRRHERPDTREICTFGPGQSRWCAKMPGTAAIDEAEVVVAAMSAAAPPTGSSQDRYLDDVPEPASALYRYQSATYVLVPPNVAIFAARMPVDTSASFKLQFRNWPGQTVARNGPGRGVVTEMSIAKQIARADAFYGSLAGAGLDIRGSVMRLSKAPPITDPEFSSWLRALPHPRHDWMAFVFPEQSGNASTQRLAWLFVRSRYQHVEHIRTFVIDDAGRNARTPAPASLPGKKVVFIGCGSMGSKIAASISAAGVGHFGLVDCDFLEPDNAVRHESGVDSFGLAKQDAVEQRLIQLNPKVWTNTQKLEIVIGAINEARKEADLQELLASASIVVETTGDHGVSRFVNDICGELRVAQVYASVTNGAWAGEVVRVIPGRTACWMCWINQYEASRPSAEPAPEVGVFAPGCDQPTFTGTGYDIGIVASLASSMVIDTLLHDEPGQKHYAADYLRWQMRDAGGNPAPRVEVLSVDKRKACPFCGSA
jgi:molybdopterin/thiamine biosynthesis adenylyltransferase